ncbi:MAG TPA: acylphosphatase [Gaiellaceae bacterium]|nr:acylphosphatase [Gaiellaceae bacterium]
MIRRRAIVHGCVQGVGFRYSLARQAQSRGVAGSAANRPDGTVEVVLEGEPEAVESLVRWCEQGPRGAVVARVDVTEEQPEGLRSFATR